MDYRCISAADDAGYGVHGAGAALRSGCVLGAWYRSFDREPRASVWRVAGGHDAGWADHCGPYAYSVFCLARVRDSRDSARDGWAACMDGSAAWHQRLADAGANCAEEHLCSRVSRTNEKEWDSLCPRRCLE